MVDVRGGVLRPPHCTTPDALKANKKMSSFKNNENIHKKEDAFAKKRNIIPMSFMNSVKREGYTPQIDLTV